MTTDEMQRLDYGDVYDYIERSYYDVTVEDMRDGFVKMLVHPNDPHAAAQAIGAVLREFGKGLVFEAEAIVSPGELYSLRFRRA